MQIQRNLQIQIENQGKHLQMMFEKQMKSDEPSAPLSSVALPSPVENLENTNEGHKKIGINGSTSDNMPEGSSQNTSTEQKGDDAKATGELELGEDQLAAPPTKRVKTNK